MNTPICDFVGGYRESAPLRLHMPGHKGMGPIGLEALDITEIAGADVLYSPKGIILESEKNAASLFRTARTVYSTEGSTLSIRAMLYLASLWGREMGRKMMVLAARNAHRAFMTGCALLDLDVEWLFADEGSLCECKINAEMLEGRLKEMSRKGGLPVALYLTSPDYLGNRLDIGVLSEICHRYGVLCLVDNAHGAYLAFLEENRHPIALGADMCADSAHKTLPVLTGGGYLHISENAPKILVDNADNAMALFGSTSPSYLRLQSLDAANAYLYNGYRGKLAEFSARVDQLKRSLCHAGYTLIGNEPMKLTLSAKPYGYTGTEIGDILYDKGIVCEFCDSDFAVMMLTPEIGEEGVSRLESVLLSIPQRQPIEEVLPKLPTPKRALSVRDALMSRSEELPLEECVGRVLANAALSCPPAVPVVVCGEVIDETAVTAMRYYGIDKCSVVKS